MMKRLGIPGILALLVAGGLFCHPAAANPLRKPLSFQHVTPKDGLSSEMVFSIAVQGDDVWFGTEGGGATLFNTA